MPNAGQGPLDWIDDELAALERSGLSRSLRTRTGAQVGRITLDGRRLVNFGSNDYLGLAADPRLAAAARVAAEEDGFGSGASPLLCGHTRRHALLQDALAEFEQVEACLLFSSGFAANVGVVSALAGRDDWIFADAKNHASLIDGCRLSRAEVHVYDHADCDHLETLLRRSEQARRRLIVTDSLFSMDGDLAPLPELARLRERFNCLLLVDEAHATGVFGDKGRGVAEHLQIEHAVDVKIGTLSKALGCAGGFVGGSRSLIEWLVNRARPYVFSTAPPTVVVAAAAEALRIAVLEPHRRRQLLDRSADLRQRLVADGWDIGHTGSQIIPLRVGESDEAMRLAGQLAEAGYFVPGIRPPSVPPREALLRLSVTCHHTPEDIDGLVAALRRLRSPQLCDRS